MRKKLTSAARCAIKMRSQEKDRSKAIKCLERDLINGSLHCFGHHEKCSADFCKTVQEKGNETASTSAEDSSAQDSSAEDSSAEENVLEDVDPECSKLPVGKVKYDHTSCYTGVVNDQCTMWVDTMDEDAAVLEDASNGAKHPVPVSDELLHDIQVCVSSLVAKAPQLIGNFTTNLAEGWMNIRCKFDGGKVINRSQSGSWDFRCMGAGLQQNLGHEWGPGAFSEMTDSAINPVYQNASRVLAKKTAKDRKRKATTKAKERRRKSKYSKKDDSVQARKAYSRHDGATVPEEVTEDVLPEILEELKQSYYDRKVQVTKEKSTDIACKTAEQGSELWKQERMKRLTASVVGGVCKMRATTSKAKKVENLLYWQQSYYVGM